EPLAPCPVELFSISSRGQNTSLAKQGLSAASTHTTSLCRQDYCVPGGRWSASSLRTSRCMTSVVTEQADPFRRGGPFRFTILSLGCNDAQNPRMGPGRSSDQCSIRLIKNRQSRSSSANRFPDRIDY